MTALPSYLNVQPLADPPHPSPPPSAHFHLLVSGWQEITISMIMTQMKLLKLITGHNTSFSALIRKLIGNRLVCFSRSTFPLYTVGLIRQIEKAIFQHGDEKKLPPNLLLLLIYLFNDTPHLSSLSCQKYFRNMMKMFIQFYEL